MGMFDYVKCLYPLPENIPEGDAFHTKDLANALLEYTITREGRLEGPSGEAQGNGFTGEIELHWTNVIASGPGLYTLNGEDAHYLGYAVTFVDSALVRVTEIENRREPALESSRCRNWELPSEEELRAMHEREQQQLTGRAMWLWWGGQETGHAVKVIAENRQQLVLQAEDQRFEIVGRSLRDRILFDSHEDGKRFNEERKAKREREREEYEDALRARAEAAQNPAHLAERLAIDSPPNPE